MHKQSELAWIASEVVLGRRQVDVAREFGISQSAICTLVRNFCNKWSGCDVARQMIYNERRLEYLRLALRNYFLATPIDGALTRPDFHIPDKMDAVFAQARREHAWLLRAEGLTYAEIGRRLGVGRDRGRQIVLVFGRRMRRATRHATFACAQPG